MVVLTIVTKKNGEEIYFEDHLPEANYVRLLSCSFYIWDTFKKGSARLGDIKSREGVSIGKIQCSSDISEPKYTRNSRQPNTRKRVWIYAYTRIRIRTYAYVLIRVCLISMYELTYWFFFC